MLKILFVCHGNICRSPMAEFLFKDMVKKKGKSSCFEIASAATSTEEIGNPIHYGTARILDKFKIDYSGKRAIQIDNYMYKYYDYIIIMDRYNYNNIVRRLGREYEDKIHLLLSYAGLNRDISDPWYTHDFNTTFDDIILGLDSFYNYLEKNNLIGE